MTRIEEIYEFALQEMKDNNIDDTPQNRVEFLKGLYDSWEEDEDVSLEKTFYMLALQTEIFRLELDLSIPSNLG
jgi:hypothetical protein